MKTIIKTEKLLFYLFLVSTSSKFSELELKSIENDLFEEILDINCNTVEKRQNIIDRIKVCLYDRIDVFKQGNNTINISIDKSIKSSVISKYNGDSISLIFFAKDNEICLLEYHYKERIYKITEKISFTTYVQI